MHSKSPPTIPVRIWGIRVILTFKTIYRRIWQIARYASSSETKNMAFIIINDDDTQEKNR